MKRLVKRVLRLGVMAVLAAYVVAVMRRVQADRQAAQPVQP